MGSKIHPPIVAVFGKNLAVLELWDLVTLEINSKKTESTCRKIAKLGKIRIRKYLGHP